MNRRRIAVVTTTRAEFGLMYWLLREILEDGELDLLLYVTGSHLSPAFGMTVQEIESHQIPVYRRLEIFPPEGDDADAMTGALGVALERFGTAFSQDRPDITVVLGDRAEVVPIALASVVHGVPVAHLHGGETSQGALDEYFRHAVTKLASVHFPATETYRRRIIQMGEAPDTVHNLGAPGLDHLHRTTLLSRDELAADLGLNLDIPTLLVTYHPVTAEPGTAVGQLDALLAAVASIEGIQAVFTKANADPEGRMVNARMKAFCRSNPRRYYLFDSLGTVRYLSCLRHLSLMAGNSSSGLIEAPSFGLPVVNVGNRQRGRTQARNVIPADCDATGIRTALKLALSPEFRSGLSGLTNPYDRFGDGKVSARIKDRLKEFLKAPASRSKAFFDLNMEAPRGQDRDHGRG